MALASEPLSIHAMVRNGCPFSLMPSRTPQLTPKTQPDPNSTIAVS